MKLWHLLFFIPTIVYAATVAVVKDSTTKDVTEEVHFTHPNSSIAGGDDLGNHTATMNLDGDGNSLTNFNKGVFDDGTRTIVLTDGIDGLTAGDGTMSLKLLDGGNAAILSGDNSGFGTELAGSNGGGYFYDGTRTATIANGNQAGWFSDGSLNVGVVDGVNSAGVYVNDGTYTLRLIDSITLAGFHVNDSTHIVDLISADGAAHFEDGTIQINILDGSSGIRVDDSDGAGTKSVDLLGMSAVGEFTDGSYNADLVTGAASAYFDNSALSAWVYLVDGLYAVNGQVGGASSKTAGFFSDGSINVSLADNSMGEAGNFENGPNIAIISGASGSSFTDGSSTAWLADGMYAINVTVGDVVFGGDYLYFGSAGDYIDASSAVFYDAFSGNNWVDYAFRYLYDSSGMQSIQFSDRQLLDSGEFVTVDYENRALTGGVWTATSDAVSGTDIVNHQTMVTYVQDSWTISSNLVYAATTTVSRIAVNSQNRDLLLTGNCVLTFDTDDWPTTGAGLVSLDVKIGSYELTADTNLIDSVSWDALTLTSTNKYQNIIFRKPFGETLWNAN